MSYILDLKKKAVITLGPKLFAKVISNLNNTSRQKVNLSRPIAGLYLRVCNRKIIFLFLNQNICCGYSKEPSQ